MKAGVLEGVDIHELAARNACTRFQLALAF
jgi:hypothetical protein